ncbi:MAG: alpha/beta fold hydrolase [Candidatus Oleimicrobiaceae bacterium]
MRRPALLAVIAAIVVLAIVMFLALRSATGPLYRPGMVGAEEQLRSPLEPPGQTAGENLWNVEPDIRLFHFEEGSGQVVLVVHGGPGYPYMAPLPALHELADRYRWVYYHQRGCGNSTRPIDRFDRGRMYRHIRTLNRALGLGAQVADIERIRRILGVDRMVLLGHSFGAFLATLYAAEFPERVRGLVLMAPAQLLKVPGPGNLLDEVRANLPAELQREYSSYLKEYLDFKGHFSRGEGELLALNARFTRFYLAAARQKGMPIPSSLRFHGNGGWMVHAMYLSMGRRHDYTPALAQVVAPVLILHGGRDLQSEAASRVYREALPHAELRILPECGHFMFGDHPEEVASAVDDFLAGLPQ